MMVDQCSDTEPLLRPWGAARLPDEHVSEQPVVWAPGVVLAAAALPLEHHGGLPLTRDLICGQHVPDAP